MKVYKINSVAHVANGTERNEEEEEEEEKEKEKEKGKEEEKEKEEEKGKEEEKEKEEAVITKRIMESFWSTPVYSKIREN